MKLYPVLSNINYVLFLFFQNALKDITARTATKCVTAFTANPATASQGSANVRAVMLVRNATKVSNDTCMKIGRNGLFNDAINTFYLRLYGIAPMIKDHSDSERKENV